MNIETRLRETMRAHATEAPAGDGIGARAWRRAGRRRAARWASAAVAAVIVGVPGAVVGPELVRAVTGPEPVVESLAAPSFGVPAVPYTPGWVPSGLAEPYVTLGRASDASGHQTGQMLQMIHEHAGGTDWESERAPLVLTTLPYDPIEAGFNPATYEHDRWVIDGTEPISVQGHPATVARMSLRLGGWAIGWEPTPGLWMLAYATNELNRSDLERYVAELLPQPTPVTVPLTLAVAPPGAVLDFVSPDYMSLIVWSDEPPFLSLRLGLTRVDELDEEWLETFTSTTAVEVDGVPAELLEGRGGLRALVVPVGSGLAVTVMDNLVGPGLALEDLVEFTAGVSVTPEARRLLGV